MMKVVTVALVLTSSVAHAATVFYDPGYDLPNRSMNDVACSDGPNGLITRYGWQDQNQIPSFPYIGASDLISGWDSPACGTCLEVTTNGTTVIMLATDHADSGVVTSEAGMNVLTKGNAQAFGKIRADVIILDGTWCGLSS